jgi:hypothetical protein
MYITYEFSYFSEKCNKENQTVSQLHAYIPTRMCVPAREIPDNVKLLEKNSRLRNLGYGNRLKHLCYVNEITTRNTLTNLFWWTVLKRHSRRPKMQAQKVSLNNFSKTEATVLAIIERNVFSARRVLVSKMIMRG